MYIAKLCIHLHPAPSSSTQLILISTQLSATSLMLLEPRCCMSLGSFPKCRPKVSELSVLTENRHTWYLAGEDSKSGIKYLKFRPKN